MHNGHTVVGGDWQSGEVDEVRDDTDLLQLRSPIELQGYIPHDLMSVAFLLEYEIGITVTSESPLNSKTVLDTGY